MNPLPEFPNLDVVRFLEPMSGGTTVPWVVGCADAEGNDRGEFVLKLRSNERGTVGMAFEVVGARLAAHFAVPMPAPAFLRIAPETLIVGTPGYARFVESIGLNFGTARIEGGFKTWPQSEPVPADLRETAARIVAFDAFIDNADRRKSKPNLLYKYPDLFVIDHEMAFAFCRLIGMGLSVPTLQDLGFLQEHPLSSAFGRLDYSGFGVDLEALSDARIQEVLEVPSAFPVDNQLEKIERRLKLLRDNKAAFMNVLSLATR